MGETFIVSDESRNYLGMVVKTDGIDISQFKRNPVMLYMHDREKGVVGRWDNVRKEGKNLLADAVFDESTELGKQVKSQVEKGFLRSASIGIEVLEMKTIDGIETVTSSVLTEISIVDIPGNDNALKLLRKVRKGERVFLALGPAPVAGDLRAQIIDLLQLDEDTTDEGILSVIAGLLNASSGDDAQAVENAIKEGLIEENSRREYISMARLSPGLFRAFIGRERDRRRATLEMMVDNAINERKILCTQKDMFLSIGQKVGIDDFARLVGSLVKYPKVSDLINTKGWTLDEYRRYDPVALKRDPALYKRLVEQEGTRPKEKNLDYYRRNNPEYLRDHPDEYKRLLNNN